MSANIPDFITAADDRINREVVESADREIVFTSTIASDGTMAVPSDYNQLKHAYIASSKTYRLQRKKAGWIYEKYPTRSADGLPKFIAREGTNFIFGPFPDSGYTVRGVYYRDHPALSSSACPMFTASPMLWIYAALAEAEPFMKNDKRIALWEAKYKQTKERVLMDTDSEDQSGSPLQMVAG